MNRRSFMRSILASGVAPAFIGASVLMPVRKLWTPKLFDGTGDFLEWPSNCDLGSEDFTGECLMRNGRIEMMRITVSGKDPMEWRHWSDWRDVPTVKE